MAAYFGGIWKMIKFQYFAKNIPVKNITHVFIGLRKILVKHFS